MVDSLEKGGFITVEADESNRRRNLLTVTDRGLEAAEAWMAKRAQVEEIMLRGFSPEEREAFSAYLTRAPPKLCRLEGGASMRDLKRLFGYLGPYRRDMFIGMALVFVETVFELIIPVLMAQLIDGGIRRRDIPFILYKGAQMGVCAVLSLICGLLYARFAARAAYGWGARIREAEFARVQQYAFSNIDHFATSSLITRMTTDVTVLQNAVNGGLRPLVRSPVMLLMGVGLSFSMNPRLAIVFFVCAPDPRPGAHTDPAQGRAHVRRFAAGGGRAQQRRAGGPHRHPRRQGLRARRI